MKRGPAALPALGVSGACENGSRMVGGRTCMRAKVFLMALAVLGLLGTPLGTAARQYSLACPPSTSDETLQGYALWTEIAHGDISDFGESIQIGGKVIYGWQINEMTQTE